MPQAKRFCLLFALLACAIPLFAQEATKPEDLVKQAIALEKDGKWQEARADYQAALAKKPSYGEALYRLGKLNLEHDSAQAAVKLLEAAGENHYDANKVEPLLAQAYFRSGVFSSAIETYLRAIDRQPKDAGLREGLAEVYYANGNNDEAHAMDSIALDLNNKDLEAHMTFGRIHARFHEFDVARAEYHKVIDADPNRVEAYEALAELFKSSQPDSAIVYYRRYLARKSDDATVNFSLSGLYYQLSQKERKDTLLKGAELQILSWRWDKTGAGSYVEAVGEVKNVSGGKLDNVEAVATFYDANKSVITTQSAIIQYNPIMPDQVSPFQVLHTYNPAMAEVKLGFDIMGGRSLRAVETGNVDSSQVALRAAYSESAFVYVGKAIQLGYNREDIFEFYVKVAVAARKRAASITALNTVLHSNPNDPQKWALLGAVYADSADTASIRLAIDSYRHACVLDSMMRRRCYAWMASQYYKQQQYDSAIAYNTKVIAIDPKAVSAYMNRAYAYAYGKKDWPRAISEVETAVSVDPKNTFPRVFLMKYYYEKKKYDSAYDMAKSILEIDSENKDAREVTKAIDDLRARIKALKEQE